MITEKLVKELVPGDYLIAGKTGNSKAKDSALVIECKVNHKLSLGRDIMFSILVAHNGKGKNVRTFNVRGDTLVSVVLSKNIESNKKP